MNFWRRFLFAQACRELQIKPIRTRLAADFTGWGQDPQKFEAQVENVIRALRTDEGAREAAPAEAVKQGSGVRDEKLRSMLE